MYTVHTKHDKVTVKDYIFYKRASMQKNTQVLTVQSGGSQQEGAGSRKCEVQDLLLEAVYLKQEVPDLRSSAIHPLPKFNACLVG